jgi:hypothetical protein
VKFSRGYSKHTLQWTVSSLLDGSLDLVIGSALLNAAGQINNGDVGGWYTHGHSSKLAIEVWDDLSDSLCGTSTARNDVLSSSTASTPVLGGWTIDSLLGGGVGVDGGHETLNDGELIMDDLGERSKAVGCAGSVGDDLNVRLVGVLVDTHNVHGSIGRRCRDDNLLGATLDVGLGLLSGGENTSGLNDVVCTSILPWDVCGVLLSVESDFLAVDDQALVGCLNGASELTVLRVVLEHVCLCNGKKSASIENFVLWESDSEVGTYGVVGFNEGIVDSDDVDVIVLNGISEDDTTNAAETVDTDLCLTHGSVKMLGGDLVISVAGGDRRALLSYPRVLDDVGSRTRTMKVV